MNARTTSSTADTGHSETENALNASKYTDKPSQIWVTVETTASDAVIRVRDTGVGMSADELIRVFNLFEQADTSIARTRCGLGIGLTLVKRITEMHGGTVSATSPGLGQGSEVIVRLPLSPSSSPSAPTRRPGQASGPPKSSRRILVVDDNVDAALSVDRLLKLWGHDVQIAFSGVSAIEKARAFKPDIVLLDIGMPGMSGYEVAKSRRAEPNSDGVKIFALTGYGQAEDRRRSQEAGFNQHLTKPPDPEILSELMEAPETFTWISAN